MDGPGGSSRFAPLTTLTNRRSQHRKLACRVAANPAKTARGCHAHYEFTDRFCGGRKKTPKVLDHGAPIDGSRPKPCRNVANRLYGFDNLCFQRCQLTRPTLRQLHGLLGPAYKLVRNTGQALLERYWNVRQ